MAAFWQNVCDFLKEDVTRFFLLLLAALAVLFVGLRLIRLCMRAFDRSRLSARLDPTARSFLHSLFSIGLDLLLVITIAGIVGIPTASIIALLGSVGVAIGLAMQGSLGNLAGGVMLLLFKPFVQGDFIKVGDNESGRVSSISIFYTTLVTVDNRQLVIPNGTVSNSPITNFTSRPTRRLELAFSVAYAADSDRVRAAILSVAAGREKLHSDPAPEVVVKALADSAVVYELHAWCDGGDYLAEKFALTEGVKRRLDAEGLSIPFPQLDVHMV